MKILGFDPGEKHTGWALIVDGKVVKAGELKGWERLENLFTKAQPDVVVAEGFRLYPSKARALGGNRLYVARVLGVIEFLCYVWNIEFVEQMAARIRRDPMVRGIKHSKSRHANDAVKHAMAYWYAKHTKAYG